MELPAIICGQAIERGSILHSEIFDDIDHGKFFIVMGVTEDAIVGFFFINSQINRYILARPILLELQFQLLKKDYGFLHHDSYISASALREFSKEKLAQSMSQGITTYVSNLRECDMNLILDACRKSPLYDRDVICKFFY